jgi:hypothetical protein
MTPAPMSQLVAIEAHRAVARRSTRVLVGLALLAITITGVAAFVLTADFRSKASPDTSLARLTDLWRNGGDSVLGITILFLSLGALIGGATVGGADWRTGGMTTLCTWEPRRARLLVARLVAAASCAALIALALQAVFVAALLPTILAHGTTKGATWSWAADVASGLARSSLLIGLAAALGTAIATIGRNTTAALGAAFAYLAVVEGIVRGNWPMRARWLIGENATIFFSGNQLDTAPFRRSPLLAGITLTAYAVVIAVVAVEVFRRRDIGAAT